MKKARVIYNPTSGKELLKKNLADILLFKTSSYSQHFNIFDYQ
ncbi:hypothetical protein K4E_24520 [Enterococcus thailandicus]|nr:hypothetical protein K4E_24520 [Enterococcus thailandicus]